MQTCWLNSMLLFLVADAFRRDAQCIVCISQPWHSKRTSCNDFSASCVQLFEQFSDILHACFWQFWGQLHEPNQSSLLNLGQVWFPCILWIYLLFHRGGTPFPLQSCWSVRRTHSSSHICLPLLHVGSHKKAYKIQLQLVFQLDPWLVGDCF